MDTSTRETEQNEVIITEYQIIATRISQSEVFVGTEKEIYASEATAQVMADALYSKNEFTTEIKKIERAA